MLEIDNAPSEEVGELPRTIDYRQHNFLPPLPVKLVFRESTTLPNGTIIHSDILSGRYPYWGEVHEDGWTGVETRILRQIKGDEITFIRK